jgi:hypothetical protein
MPRLARLQDGDSLHSLYLVVACTGGTAPRADCYSVSAAGPGEDDRLVAYCPSRGKQVRAEELIPPGTVFDLLADPSFDELNDAIERLERQAAEGAGDRRDEGWQAEARLVELELRILIRRSEVLALASERGARVTPVAREAWVRDKRRIRGLLRRWGELTGVPILIDLDHPTWESAREAGSELEGGGRSNLAHGRVGGPR